MQGYSAKLPLTQDKYDGFYNMNKTAVESIKQDFKMLILTNPGEKMMNPNYGVGLRALLFSRKEPGTTEIIKQTIQNQVNLYMNFISLENIIFNDLEEQNSIYIKIIYYIKTLNALDQLDFSLNI